MVLEEQVRLQEGLLFKLGRGHGKQEAVEVGSVEFHESDSGQD
jgi:hypothetical protein